jgi:hypothetical protein
MTSRAYFHCIKKAAMIYFRHNKIYLLSYKNAIQLKTLNFKLAIEQFSHLSQSEGSHKNKEQTGEKWPPIGFTQTPGKW